MIRVRELQPKEAFEANGLSYVFFGEKDGKYIAGRFDTAEQCFKMGPLDPDQLVERAP